MSLKEVRVENSDRHGTAYREAIRTYDDGGVTPSRVAWWVGLAGFALPFAMYLLQGKWLMAAFFLATGFLVMKGRKIDGWPKAAQYVLIFLYAALWVATFAQLLRDFKTLA